MIDYSKKFGFGSVTGIELPGEEEGILYNPDHMYQPDIATMSIGQGIAVTPLQMLRAICAIANGGELLQPYIIDKIVMPDGRVLRQGQKKVVRRVMSEEVAAQMRGMMEQVVAAVKQQGSKATVLPVRPVPPKNLRKQAVMQPVNILLLSWALYLLISRSMRC